MRADESLAGRPLRILRIKKGNQNPAENAKGKNGYVFFVETF